MKKSFYAHFALLVLVMCACNPGNADFKVPSGETEVKADSLPLMHSEYSQLPDYREYLDFFKEVYRTMEENYYHPLDPQDLMKFVYVFNTKIFDQLRKTGKSSNYIKWRSAAFLIDALKADEDIFSKFFPPKDAKRFEGEVLGKRVDLGIEGALTFEGFVVLRVEPRSDAFEKGLREKDVIRSIDGTDVLSLAQEKIMELLTPLEGASVKLRYFDAIKQAEAEIEIVSKEYFKQTVFMVPVDIPGVFCLQIQRFNRATGEDMAKFMAQILAAGDTSLIIDLRGNPGGPPLAAQEISAFFLTPNEEFAYFQKKDRPKAVLQVPEIPEEQRYKGEIAILVNEKSGSASELFSGIMQRRGRAVLIGKNTAGQVFLKSMFYFSDNSMVLLVTARGHHPDGEVFSFSGVKPDIGAESDDLVRFAAEYLAARTSSD